jgi:hypothetical protein
MRDETLAARLPLLLPRVIAWARRESQRILQSGKRAGHAHRWSLKVIARAVAASGLVPLEGPRTYNFKALSSDNSANCGTVVWS